MAKIKNNLDKTVDTNINRVVDKNNTEINMLKDIQQKNNIEIDSLKNILKANSIEIERLKGIQIAKEAELNGLKNILKANSAEIERLNGIQIAKEAEIDRLKGLLQIKETEIENLKNIEQGKPNTTSRSIRDVYQNITGQFAGLENITGGYKLSNLSLDLKVLVDNNLNVSLIDNDPTHRINGATVSSMKVDFDRQLQETTRDIIGTLMPDVVGLTENACRQVLTSIGLKLDPVHQFGVKNIPVGQAFRQSVKQGSKVSANDLVTVIFAK